VVSGHVGGGSFNLAIDSLANAVTIWPSTVSPPKIFRPHTTTRFGVDVHSWTIWHHHFHPKRNAISSLSPGASAAGSTLKRRETRKTNPASKGDEDSSTSRTQAQSISNFNSNCREMRQLAPPSPSSPSMNKEKERARRKAINACYRSAQTSHPTLPQQQPQCRVWRYIRTRAGEFEVERD
jgi:hypothetical protein